MLTELLPDGGQLLAQQVLALRALHALGHVGTDPILELQLGQRFAAPRQDQLDPAVGVERLEQLHLALHRQLRPVAGRVGQPARVGDAPQDVAERPDAPVLGDGLEDGPQLAGCLHARPVRRGRLLDDFDVDPQGGPAAAVAAPMVARSWPCTTMAGVPPGRAPDRSTWATVPTRA